MAVAAGNLAPPRLDRAGPEQSTLRLLLLPPRPCGLLHAAAPSPAPTWMRDSSEVLWLAWELCELRFSELERGAEPWGGLPRWYTGFWKDSGCRSGCWQAAAARGRLTCDSGMGGGVLEQREALEPTPLRQAEAPWRGGPTGPWLVGSCRSSREMLPPLGSRGPAGFVRMLWGGGGWVGWGTGL